MPVGRPCPSRADSWSGWRAYGLGVLIASGLFAPGCGDDGQAPMATTTGASTSTTSGDPATTRTDAGSTSTGTPPTPMGGDCCRDHPLAGCDEPTCQDAVCADDPFCCNLQWDAPCTDLALTLCPSCAPGTTSSTTDGTDSDSGRIDDCCTPTPGVAGCPTDPPVEACTCTIDEFCCAEEWDQICVDTATRVCDAGCDPGGGSCCTPKPTKGCDDATCRTRVCGVDPFCCDRQWDAGCADQAAGICAVCGGDDGDCCVENPGQQGCDDAACVATICAPNGPDPSCCTVEWTQACADLAVAECAVCGAATSDTGPGDDCCVATGAIGCADVACEAEVCAVDPFCCASGWDVVCADQAAGICDVCGGGSGDCCVAGPGMQGCDDAACVHTVCGQFGLDPTCCSVEWTAACAALAVDACSVCASGSDDGTATGGTGDCCTGHGTPGCDDATCETAVCLSDPFCCSMQWDDQCAEAAEMMCALACGGGTSGGGVFACDAAQISACPAEDPVACTCSGCMPGGGCALQEDCVCPDCAADAFCANPASCNHNGLCDPFNEGCVCPDCADHPLCP